MSGLQEFHHFEERTSRTRKIVTWVALVLIFVGAAFYAVEAGMLKPNPEEAGHSYPRGL